MTKRCGLATTAHVIHFQYCRRFVGREPSPPSSSTRGRSSSLTPLIAVASLLIGCGTDADTLPTDFNEQRVKVFSVDYATEIGSVGMLSGLQGGTQPTIVGDQNLLGLYGFAAANIVRIPEGYLCRYTMSGTFPNKSLATDDPASYDFAQIEPVLDGLLGLGTVQGQPVVRLYQAMFDVGLDTCSVGPQ
ncbi:MAG: hypothetical protein ACI9OJ_002188, partial [Myxococcota bacterium]